MIATFSPGDSLSHMTAIPQPVPQPVSDGGTKGGTKRITVQDTDAPPASNMQHGPQATVQPHPQWPHGGDMFATVGYAAVQGARFAVGELSKPGPDGNPSSRAIRIAIWLGVSGNLLATAAIMIGLGHQFIGNRTLEDDQVKLGAAVTKLESQNSINQEALNKRIAAIEISQLEQGKAVTAMGASISGMAVMMSWLVRAEDARSRGEKPPRAPLPFEMPG